LERFRIINFLTKNADLVQKSHEDHKKAKELLEQAKSKVGKFIKK